MEVTSVGIEWVIKFNSFSGDMDSEVHIVHLSHVITAYTLASLSSFMRRKSFRHLSMSFRSCYWCTNKHLYRIITLMSYKHQGMPNHQKPDCLINSLFEPTIKETSSLHNNGNLRGECGGFPSQMSSYEDLIPHDVIMHKTLGGSLLLTWFNFNLSMDK